MTESKSLLIGESANQRVEDGIRAILEPYTEVMHVNELLTMHMGPDFILANSSIDFRDDLAAVEMEKPLPAWIARSSRSIPALNAFLSRQNQDITGMMDRLSGKIVDSCASRYDGYSFNLLNKLSLLK